MAITAAQRQERRKYLGSSDMPAILGVSPYKTQLDVWVDKIEPPAGESSSHAMQTGNYMEAAMVEYLRHEHGLDGVTQRMVIDEGQILAVNLDFDAADQSCLAEFKFVGSSNPSRDSWGEHGTDDIPIDVMVQVQTQLTVTGRPRALVVACFPSDFGLDFRPYFIYPHERLIHTIRNEAARFWHQFVEPRVRPPQSDLPDYDTLARIPRTPGSKIDVPLSRMMTYAALRELRLRIEKAEDAAKTALVAEMGDAEIAVAGDWTMRLATEQQVRVDADELRAAGLYGEYSKVLKVRKNYVKGPKGASAIDAAAAALAGTDNHNDALALVRSSDAVQRLLKIGDGNANVTIDSGSSAADQ